MSSNLHTHTHTHTHTSTRDETKNNMWEKKQLFKNVG